MTIHVPFRLPLSGFAECKKVQANFDFLTDQLESINTGLSSWDAIAVGTASAATGVITLYNATNSNTIGLQAGVTSASYTLTLPTTAGTVGQFLVTDGAGVLSWSGSSGITHNSLSGLQGGTAAEYYHLTAAQHAIATQAASASVAGYVTTGTQTIAGAKTFSGNFYLSGYTASLGLLYVAADGLLTQLGFDTGKVLTSTSGAYAYSSLTGTSNQITITPSAGAFTFSTPQDIATSSVVRFAQVILKDGTAAAPDLVLTSGASAENTGLYGSGTSLNFSVAGVLQGAMDNAGGLSMTGEVRGVTSRVTTNAQISTGASGIVTIQAAAAGGAYVLTLPVDDGTTGQVLTTDGAGVLSWAAAGSGANIALSNLASVSINTSLISDSNNVDDLGGVNLWANGYFGTMHLGQSGIPGDLHIYAAAASNGYLRIQSGNNIGDTVVTVATAAQGGARAYTIPDAGGNADFVMTLGTQTVGGAKTFSSAVTVNPTANQLVLGATRTVTLTAPTPATTSRVVTIPDLSADYSVVGTEGAQTVNGSKTFGDVVVHPVGSVSVPSLTFTGDTDTGFYHVGANDIGVALGGFKAVEFIQGAAAVAQGYTPLGLYSAGVTGQFTIGSNSAITTAKAFNAANISAALMLVCGNDGAGNSFVDLILTTDAAVAPAVISSHTIAGSPAARTYSVAGQLTKVAFASGTYSVKSIGLAVDGAT